jgi:uncharacterized Tic20 family protein
MVSNSGDGSNRGKYSKAGLIALAFVVALILGAVFINSGLSRDAVYQRQADANAREYSAYTDQQIRQSCVRLVGDEKANCIAKYRQERRNNERNEQDLVAQRQSANWAYIMGAAAVIGMVLSVIGVVLVWTTFDETRRANILSKAQQRARISMEFDVLPNIDPKFLNIVISGCNIGHSAAFNCIIRVAMFPSLPNFSAFDGIPSVPRNIASNTCEQMTVVFCDAATVLGTFVAGKIEYDCIFGQNHTSYFCVRIIPSDLTQSRWVAMKDKPTDWPKDT